VVVDPVGDVAAPFLDQVVEGAPGLLQAGAEPAGGAAAGGLADALHHVADGVALVLGGNLVEARGIGAAMAHEIPAKLDASRHDLRVMVAYVGVERDGAADAVGGEQIHQTDDADPVAVVALAPVPYLGRAFLALGALVGVARHG